MSNTKHNEAELLQARERIARAFTRLSKLSSAIPERMLLLERSRADALNRLTEAQALLESERKINAQRDSLSESAKIKLGQLSEQLTEHQNILIERDAQLAELQHSNHALEAIIKEANGIRENLENSSKSLELKLSAIEEENEYLRQEIERLRLNEDASQASLQAVKAAQDKTALSFTKEERDALLQTVDGLIGQIDQLTSSNGYKK